ncbi:hypothetical protein ATC04_07055 [Arthrobacter sp. YC-RL1]|nr:hypothetical protein ATC04_07055 [Arthrobacter sp. YC-RL1]
MGCTFQHQAVCRRKVRALEVAYSAWVCLLRIQPTKAVSWLRAVVSARVRVLEAPQLVQRHRWVPLEVVPFFLSGK